PRHRGALVLRVRGPRTPGWLDPIPAWGADRLAGRLAGPAAAMMLAELGLLGKQHYDSASASGVTGGVSSAGFAAGGSTGCWGWGCWRGRPPLPPRVRGAPGRFPAPPPPGRA